MYPVAEVEGFIVALFRERDAFVALHTELSTAHREWVPGKDARLSLVAKPINHILSACVNLRLTQQALAFPQWWAINVHPDINTEKAMEPAIADVLNFYRFGFFQFLCSNMEHGLRAIQPSVVKGVDSQADTKYWKVYTTLFQAALREDLAEQHINVFAFLATLRNTIHNNGVHSPPDHKDAVFVIGNREYHFRDGCVVEAFGWNHIISYLPHIREALTDLMRSPLVSLVPRISDFASTPLSGLAPTSDYDERERSRW